MQRINLANARKTLASIKKCAVEAGIYHAWFLCFGTTLGAVRPSPRIIGEGTRYMRGFIEHDDDIDIGIFPNMITAAQETEYIRLLREEGMFNCREEKQRRADTNRLLWFTLRREKPPVGTKCCHWFWYRWRGYWWHSKGKDWLQERKFPTRKWKHEQSDDALSLGIPEEYLNAGLMEVEFEGDMYNIPIKSGYCVDYWYPGWAVPKEGGASSKKIVGLIGNWADEQTWKIY